MQRLAVEERESTAVLDGTLPANDQRQDYIRAVLRVEADGRRMVSPHAAQDSSMQRIMQSSQALIVRPPYAPAAVSGTSVSVLLLDF
jgi:molybdopterin molybdotransferase